MTRPPTVDARLRAAMRVDDRLDDLRRARIGASLDAALAATPRARGPRRPWAIAVAVAAAVALVLVGALAVRLAPSAGSRAAPQSVEVPAGASAHAQLSAAARVTLHGPAHLDLSPDGGERVTLTRGTLIGSYDHRAGGRLIVQTPHAAIAVVGTLFAVEVDATTCVAVAHGLVDVTAGAVRRRLERGQRWCVDATELAAVPPALDRLLVDHEGPIAAAPRPADDPPAHDPPADAPPADDPPADDPLAHDPPAHVPPADDPPATASPSPLPVTPRAPTIVGADRPRAAPPPPAPAAATDADAGASPAAEAHADRDLYAAAEQALRYGDTALADALLARLVAEHVDSDLTDEAHYERAQLAYARGAWATARASLDRLLAGRPTPLRDPARLLRCRIAVRTDDGDAAPCLDALRANARDPAVALEALELRVQHAFDHSGCAAAERFVRELRAAAPDRPAAAAWRRRCPSPEPP